MFLMLFCANPTFFFFFELHLVFQVSGPSKDGQGCGESKKRDCSGPMLDTWLILGQSWLGTRLPEPLWIGLRPVLPLGNYPLHKSKPTRALVALGKHWPASSLRWAVKNQIKIQCRGARMWVCGPVTSTWLAGCQMTKYTISPIKFFLFSLPKMEFTKLSGYCVNIL